MRLALVDIATREHVALADIATREHVALAVVVLVRACRLEEATS